MERNPLAIRVFLVAENRLLREALVHLLEKCEDTCVVGHCLSSELNWDQLVDTRSDVLLVDSIESASAQALFAQFKEGPHQVKIILFGMDEDPGNFLRAVCLGISGYVLKNATSAELIAAVRKVSQGEGVCPPKLCLSLFHVVSQDYRKRLSVGEQRSCLKLGLTSRQHQLLALVARGLTNKEISLELNISEFTVKNHVHRIIRQMNVGNRREAANAVHSSELLAVV